jgi:hypothetical protein
VVGIEEPDQNRLEDVELSKKKAKARQGKASTEISRSKLFELPLTESACGCPPPQIREVGEHAKAETTRYGCLD